MKHIVGRSLALFAMLSIALPDTLLSASARPLTVDDVLGLEHLDTLALSPDGRFVVAAVQRAAAAGDAYGRAAYEIDPTRDDLWLVSTTTAERRAITRGHAQAAGAWCPSWSPDGARIAYLSTAPEGREPRGGDNVRLYAWARETGRTRRLDNAGVMTQTRYGSGLYPLDLRGGADGGSVPHACRAGDEGAPFTWLDATHLLALTLPPGQVSAALDQYARPFASASRDEARIRTGEVSTAHAVGSGAAAVQRDGRIYQAQLRIMDAVTGTSRVVATVLTYPFGGALSIAVSPDRKTVAILSTTGRVPPRPGHPLVSTGDTNWTVEKRLGFVSLRRNSAVRWVALPPDARLPVELFAWSPDSRQILIRARANQADTSAALFVARSDGAGVSRLGPHPVAGPWTRTWPGDETPVVWVNADHLLARLQVAGGRADWWLLGLDGRAANVTSGRTTVPTRFQRGNGGSLIAVGDGHLLHLDPATAQLAEVGTVASGSHIVWPLDAEQATSRLLLATSDTTLRRLDLATGASGPVTPLKPGQAVQDATSAASLIITGGSTEHGFFVDLTDMTNGGARRLLTLDGQLDRVSWGETRLLDYLGADGKPLHAAMILPPGYQPERRYPTLLWVYPGYVVDDLASSYWLDPFLPGIYNLQLYAAQGYVVIVPSLPLPPEAQRHDVPAALLPNTLAAVNQAVALGIADPDRVGVFGQSGGGYATLALVTQTRRFRAAAAIASISDPASAHGAFDPGARGFDGIEHEKSDNWAESGTFGLNGAPYADPATDAAAAPLAHADHVETPVLLIQGDLDMRGAPDQAERFFYALYERGKTARYVRYGGESHSLAQSPANVRDAYREIVAWFDRYLAPLR